MSVVLSFSLLPVPLMAIVPMFEGLFASFDIFRSWYLEMTVQRWRFIMFFICLDYWSKNNWAKKRNAKVVNYENSSLVWIDQYNECNGMTSFMEFMSCNPSCLMMSAPLQITNHGPLTVANQTNKKTNISENVLLNNKMDSMHTVTLAWVSLL